MLKRPVSNVLVVGGNGYVGSHVAKLAVELGYNCSSLSRSGAPKFIAADELKRVRWLKGDILHRREDIERALKDVDVVVCCVGGFGSVSHMRAINGSAIENVVNAAADAGVKRLSFISAYEYEKLIPQILTRGYIEGKRAAEVTIRRRFDRDDVRAVIVRPGFIYGKRQLKSTDFAIPIHFIGIPLRAITQLAIVQWLGTLPIIGNFIRLITVTPVPVEAVAKAALLPLIKQDATVTGTTVANIQDILAYDQR